MKKSLILLGSIAILFSCNSETTQNEQTTQEDVATQQDITASSNQDTTKVDEVSNEASSSLSGFKYFNDYAKIKTKQELLTLFGASQVAFDTTYYAEGTVMMKRAKLRDTVNHNFVQFLFKENSDSIAFIEAPFQEYNDDFEFIQAHKTQAKNGLFTGMTIKELLEWNNNQEIKFYGFGWDYQGGIVLDSASKLGQSDVFARLSLTHNANEVDSRLFGDIELSTNDSLVMSAPIVLDILWLNYDYREGM